MVGQPTVGGSAQGRSITAVLSTDLEGILSVKGLTVPAVPSLVHVRVPSSRKHALQTLTCDGRGPRGRHRHDVKIM